MFDFIPILSDRSALMMYTKAHDIDLGLFIRPFTDERQVPTAILMTICLDNNISYSIIIHFNTC